MRCVCIGKVDRLNIVEIAEQLTAEIRHDGAFRADDIFAGISVFIHNVRDSLIAEFAAERHQTGFPVECDASAGIVYGIRRKRLRRDRNHGALRKDAGSAGEQHRSCRGKCQNSFHDLLPPVSVNGIGLLIHAQL